MFDLEILEVVIGLVLMYLLLSLLAATVREAIESLIRARAVHLERGIRELLADPQGKGLAKELYEHPLVYSLYAHSYTTAATRRLGRNLPTYIPARNFALALMDLAVRGPLGTPDTYAPEAVSIEGLRASARRFPDLRVQRALLAAIDDAHGDVTRVRENLEAWFDSAMDSVAGWYKRRTQGWLFAIGLVIALAVNANTLTIGEHLMRDEAARRALVASAEAVLQDSLVRERVARSARGGPAALPGDTGTAPLAAADSALREARLIHDRLSALGLPLGWQGILPANTSPLTHIVGLVLTALAITLGAPFWFDALNKMMVIRSTVKPREKSPNEGSEDRQPRAGRRAAAETLVPAGTPGAAGGAAAGAVGGRGGGAGGGTALAEGPPPGYTPNEWDDGAEDGLL